jgi:hypothetical protein
MDKNTFSSQEQVSDNHLHTNFSIEPNRHHHSRRDRPSLQISEGAPSSFLLRAGQVPPRPYHRPVFQGRTDQQDFVSNHYKHIVVIPFMGYDIITHAFDAFNMLQLTYIFYMQTTLQQRPH